MVVGVVVGVVEVVGVVVGVVVSVVVVAVVVGVVVPVEVGDVEMGVHWCIRPLRCSFKATFSNTATALHVSGGALNCSVPVSIQ